MFELHGIMGGQGMIGHTQASFTSICPNDATVELFMTIAQVMMNLQPCFSTTNKTCLTMNVIGMDATESSSMVPTQIQKNEEEAQHLVNLGQDKSTGTR